MKARLIGQLWMGNLFVEAKYWANKSPIQSTISLAFSFKLIRLNKLTNALRLKRKMLVVLV